MIVMPRVLLAAAVVSLAGFAQEKGPAPVPVPNAILVARSWDEAIQEATIRNVPILFTTSMAV
jgi:hypothetical protein